MSFKARLKVGGSEYNILNCNYGLHQETDPTGRPSSIIRGGRITVTIESSTDNNLSDWAYSNFEMRDGSIVFLKRDTEATAKELIFKNAYMVKYNENFDANGQNPMTETFTLSAKIIEMGTAAHENEWVV